MRGSDNKITITEFNSFKDIANLADIITWLNYIFLRKLFLCE